MTHPPEADGTTPHEPGSDAGPERSRSGRRTTLQVLAATTLAALGLQTATARKHTAKRSGKSRNTRNKKVKNKPNKPSSGRLGSPTADGITFLPTGPTGPAGVIGPTGPPGPAGGPQGPQGALGPQGAAGPQGDPGLAGVQGPQGAGGVQGPPGTGDTGSQGPAGPQGASGVQGAQGVAGSLGLQGDQGPVGSDGAQGPQGQPGAGGAQGAQGAPGGPGSQGPTGVQGPTGPAGSGGGIQSATVGGQLGLNSLTYGDTNPSGPSVSVTVSASGMVVVTLSAELWAGVGGDGCMSFSSSGGSGNFSPDDSRALCLAGGSQNAAIMAASRTVLLTGLSAGQHTFTAVFRKRRSAPFFNVTNPEIIVMPVS